MNWLPRIGGLIVLLLATVGILGCIAAIAGISMFRQTASEKMQNLSARLEVGLERVSTANQRVQHALAKARAEVATVNKESARLSGDDEQRRSATGVLRLLIRQSVKPRINDVGGRLATLSDTAVAVSSLLQSLEELPLVSTRRIQTDKLQRLTDLVSQLPGPLQKLEAVVGAGDKAPAAGDVAAAANEVDLVLQRCQETLIDWQSNLDIAGQELRDLTAEMLTWLTCVVIAFTILCLWAAAGQVSLFAHALTWCRLAR